MPTPIAVTADNFARAETDMYFGLFVSRGALGRFYHYRQLPPLEGTGVRPKRDTLYSEAVFDLDAGPVTITLPDPGDRFFSIIVIDQDHYVATVAYGAGSHTLTRDDIGTRYVFAAVRALIDPADPGDLDQSMRCRTRSRSTRPIAAASRLRTGTPRVKRRSATPSCRSPRHCQIYAGEEAAGTKSIRSGI